MEIPSPSHILPQFRPAARVSLLTRGVCAYCKAPLTIHEKAKGDTCDELLCRTRKAVEFALAKDREEAAALTRIAVEFRERFAQNEGVSNPAALRLTIIRNFERPISTLPQDRRASFRRHLKNFLREAQKSVPMADVKSMPNVTATAPESPLIGACCATCRGSCCRYGGNRAHLDRETIVEYWMRNPHLRPGEILKRYSRKLPAETFSGSCVFHGAHGCGLPREMRSSTCNKHFCHGLISLRTALQTTGPQPVLLVTTDQGKIQRAALIESSGKATAYDVPAVDQN